MPDILANDGVSNDTLVVRVKRLDPDVPMPEYAYEGDAGLDLVSAEDVDLAPFERYGVQTGISIAIPNGYAGFVQPRSGLSLKRGLTVVNTPGLIDSNYRGEIKVPVINVNPNENVSIRRGDRIAQLVIQRVPNVRLMEVETLDETERGDRGFGSSLV